MSKIKYLRITHRTQLLLLLLAILPLLVSQSLVLWLQSLLPYRTMLLILLPIILIIYTYKLLYQSRLEELESAPNKPKRKIIKSKNNGLRILKNLSIEEKEILSQFIFSNQKTINFHDDSNPVLINLLNHNILYRPIYVQKHGFDFSFPFTMQNWAWEMLNKNDYLLN